MGRHRYHFLYETCPANEIEKMICRVVADKLLPLHKYAPAKPRSAQDIVPDILPEPFIYENRKDFIESVDESAVRTGLATFLDIDFAARAKESVSLESKQIKRYTLDNPGNTFNKLMQNPEYAQEVREFLKETYGRAYIVVGFLTATGTIWTTSKERHNSAGFRVTVPVSSFVAIPGFADPEIKPKASSMTRHERHENVVEEEIFAVAYDEVKTSYSFDRSARKIRRNPKLGRAVWTQGKALGFSNDSDSSDDEDEDAEEEIPNVMFVKSRPDSGDDAYGARNYFDCEMED
jgi:hypothetical protein